MADNVSLNSNGSLDMTADFEMPADVIEFQWWTEGVMILAVGTLGLLGNCASIWTFSRQRVHRVFHNLLLVLAIFDIVR